MPEPRKNLIAPYANLIMNKFPIITDKNTGVVYIYKDGYYESHNSIPTLKHEIQELMREKANNHLIENIIGYIIRETYEEILTFDPSSEYVCVKNGIFNMRTQTLEEHTHQKYVGYRIPIYCKSAEEIEEEGKQFSAYIDSLTGSEADSLKLQEAVGNIFANHSIAKKLFYIYGARDSGKSTFFNILQEFLSPLNYSNLTLYQLTEKFTNAQLYGKRANICSDIPFKIKLKNFGIIKQITGGDKITAQFKNKNSFSFVNIAKIFFSGNGIPLLDLLEADDAWYGRWEFIKFPHHFEPDDEIYEVYTTDDMKSAIFLWALEGYQRLKEKKWKFTNQTSEEQAKYLFETADPRADSFVVWLVERCHPARPEFHLLPEDLFNSYRDWCIDNGKVVTYKTKESFCRRLYEERHAGFSLSSERLTIGGEQKTVVRGITWNPKFSD